MRTAAVAGMVTAGAAVVSLVHTPGAVADPHASAVAPTAMSTSAPAAFSPDSASSVIVKSPVTGSDAADNGDEAADDSAAETTTDDTATDDTATDDAATDDGAAADTATQAAQDDAAAQEESAPADKGRGAEYNADGTIVVIDKAEQPKPQPASAEQIDQWINEALDVMKAHGIPGSYDGIKSNLIRESSGDPHTINMWDSNAVKNIPSKGLLQVIDPTFEQYHVEGTSTDIYDPVANIVAACNYAADRYGSMDNVNSAY
ncbi:transglycosylase SLT domain-containing protein [Streptomyces xiamenensis]|uniref:transglycosylase SLT domain-containing protein n=1 Tax=Streptomyces sp. NRRL F-2890 TaxID=1463845 RepID=UPI00069504EF|nr:transglycosylase SLT domain-containing protein [Streptomyces sp. NRRL F-2890]